MRSELTIRSVHFWSCLNPDHHHKTKAVAEACIKKRENMVPRKVKWHKEKYEAMILRWIECRNFAQVDREFKTYAGHTRNHVRRAMRIAKGKILFNRLHEDSANWPVSYEIVKRLIDEALVV